jgi:hypothetical protein
LTTDIRQIPNRKGEKVLEQFRSNWLLRKHECDVRQKQRERHNHIFCENCMLTRSETIAQFASMQPNRGTVQKLKYVSSSAVGPADIQAKPYAKILLIIGHELI